MKKQVYSLPNSGIPKKGLHQFTCRPFWVNAIGLIMAMGLALAVPATLQGQTVFWSDDFETSGSPSSGTRTPELEGGSSNAYFGRAEDNGTNTLFINGNTVSFSDYSNQSGSWFWAGENHDNISGNSQSELQINWSGIDISGYSNIQFLGLFGADDSGNFESDNQVYVEYRINGSGPWVQGLRIEANNNDDWAVDTDNDGDGDSPVLSEGMTQLSFDIPATGTTMELRIRVDVDANDEEWAIDNFRLSGCASQPDITLGANPSVCQGVTAASLPYTGTTGSPTQYSINFNGAANAAGFADVTNAALPASPITISVPGAVAPGVYNGVLAVSAGPGSCPSAEHSITVTVKPSPSFDVTATPATISCGQSSLLEVSNIVGPATQQTFSNSTSISIPASGSSGDANPYPSSINVSGIPTSGITVASVQLNGLTHTYPDDLDIYLVGPNNQSIWLMSDAGGGGNIFNYQIAFEDGGTTQPNNSNLSNNATYAPDNYLGGGDPSTPGTLISALSSFSGNPNGNWSLYIYDDSSDDTGSLSSGWSITFNVLPAYTYAWSNGPVSASQTVEPTMTTVYDVTVTDPSSTCYGTGSVSVTVTEDAGLTIALGPNPTVCQGATTASLPYTSVSPNADLYSLDFDGAANSAGFVDVPADVLPASPISIAVPGGVAPGTYNATLTLINGSTSCNSIGFPVTIEVGTAPSFDISATPATINCGESSLLEVTNVIGGGSGQQEFANNNNIDIPASGSSGIADPYPSSISVTGLPASGVTVASVQLNGLTHTNPDDLDIYLVGPNSQSIWLMSDAGGTGNISNYQLSFADGGTTLPNSSSLSNNTTYAPLNYGSPDFVNPPPSLISTLSAFSGSPNGTWSLYIYDDNSSSTGSLDGWSITFNVPNSITYAWSNGPTSASQTVSPTETTNYAVTVTNQSNMCFSSQNVTVTLQDNVAPTALCQDVTVELDASGNGSTTAAAVNNSSSDNCGSIASMSLSQTDFSCADVGSNAVTLIVTDASSNSSSCSANVTVEDNIAPTVVCQNVTVQLDASGNGSSNPFINGALVSRSDNCSLVGTISITGPHVYNCSHIGTMNINMIQHDVNGNTSTCSYVVTIVDNLAPMASCQNITVQLDASGNASIEAGDVDDVSSDNCGIASSSVSPSSFTCANIGANAATLTVTDASSNSASCAATVTVQDNVAPTALCQNVTVQLDAGGNGSTTAAAVNNGSSDNCGIASMSLSPTAFTCADVGSNAVTLTVTDVNGNSSSCSANVTVQDNVVPTALCQNLTVQLNAGGSAGATAAQVDNSSFDNCGIASMSLSPTAFTCANVGSNAVTLTVTDVNGNSASCSATVTVQDNSMPTAACQNVTVQLDASGSASVTTAQVNNSSSDNCGIAGLSVSPSLFTCANIGPNAVTLTVTDVNGNSGSCAATVTVQDNVAPTALCQNVTVQLNASGNGSTTATAVNNGSSDACGIASMSLSPTAFTCANVGSNTVTLTVTDVNGNSSTCSANVTVQENIPPTALCQNVTVQLNASGSASVTATQVNNSSTDNCSISSMSVAPNTFGCIDEGENAVTLTVTDGSGNSSTCSATVTVEDNQLPVAVCQNVTVQLDASGYGSTTAAEVGSGSTDACGIQSAVLSEQSFDCADVGANPVTLTVTDVNGNSSSCSATVTVQDNIAPTALCQNVTIQLDASGEASVKIADIDGGSTDACGIETAALGQQYFYCPNLGTNAISLTVTDANGNSSSCGAIVTVEDQIAPVAVCKNTTVYLSPEGTYTLDESEVLDFDNSYDNCGFTVTGIMPATFGCEDAGAAQSVMVSIEDAAGNFASCNATVTVEIGTGLPEPWIGTDIGSQGGGSSYDYNPCAGETGAFTITTGANNSLPTMDNLGFINRQLCGDFTITVRIENVTPTGYAGIVIREDNTPGSRMIGEYSNHSTLLRWEARLVANGPKTFNFFNAPLPYWLRLQRAGNWFLGYYSFDGVNFYLVSAQNMPMAPCVRAGMGAYTNITGTPVTAVFTNVSVQGGIIPLLSAPAVEIPQAAVGKEALNVSLYPNPARDVVTLALSRTADPGQSGQVLPGGVAHSLSPGKSSEVRVRLLNQQGQLVEERQLEGLGQAYEWDIHSLPAGLYFMEVQLEGELPQMVRFIKAN